MTGYYCLKRLCVKPSKMLLAFEGRRLFLILFSLLLLHSHKYLNHVMCSTLARVLRLSQPRHICLSTVRQRSVTSPISCCYRLSLAFPFSCVRCAPSIAGAEELSAPSIQTHTEQPGAERLELLNGALTYRSREAVNSFTAKNCNQPGTRMRSLPGLKNIPF